MDPELLTNLGLTDAQARVYNGLLANGPHTPPALAKLINDSRTNTYNVLEKLTDLGLVKKEDINKKLVFSCEPPTALEKLARQRREAALKEEQTLHANMPDLLSAYFRTHEQPGVRFYRGTAELKDIYDDQIATGQPIYIIRPDYNMDVYDFDFMSEIRHMARRAGIPRYAITPDRDMAPKNHKESDPYMLLERTWLPAGDYTAPVEWNAYGNKLAVMSFGAEAIGMIIESPQIAESFRQLYKLLNTGIKRMPGYDKLPLQAGYLGSTKANPHR